MIEISIFRIFAKFSHREQRETLCPPKLRSAGYLTATNILGLCMPTNSDPHETRVKLEPGLICVLRISAWQNTSIFQTHLEESKLSTFGSHGTLSSYPVTVNDVADKVNPQRLDIVVDLCAYIHRRMFAGTRDEASWIEMSIS